VGYKTKLFTDIQYPIIKSLNVHGPHGYIHVHLHVCGHVYTSRRSKRSVFPLDPEDDGDLPRDIAASIQVGRRSFR
jgi:hypothetical protein